MDAGRTWRVHAWTRAKAQHPEADLPPDIIRMRVARARELGLAYADYARVRAASGRDIGGFLISSNALGVFRTGDPVPAGVGARLTAMRHVRRIALAYPGLDPDWLAEALPALDAIVPAPPPMGRWPQIRAALAHAQAQTPRRLPAQALVAVTALRLEDDWLVAGGLGAQLPAAALFGVDPAS